MIRKKIKSTLVIGMMLVSLYVSVTPLIQAQIPYLINGYVYIDDVPAPNGIEVSISINGIPAGSNETYNNSGQYVIWFDAEIDDVATLSVDYIGVLENNQTFIIDVDPPGPYSKNLHVNTSAPPANNPPTVSISSPSEGATVSGTISITGTATDPDGDGELQKVQVRIDSGSWVDATGTTSWNYSWDTTGVSEGSHTIYARAYDGKDYSPVDSVSVTVDNEEEPNGGNGDNGGNGGGDGTPPKPTADAGGPYYAELEDGVAVVSFDGSGSTGTISTYSWVFGDGETGTGVKPTHTYTVADNYTVSLTVSGSAGSDTGQTWVIITEEPNIDPTDPDVSGPQKGSANTDYEYSAVSTDDDNDTIQYIFQWGDGTNSSTDFVENGTAASATHNWSSWGIYAISVKASDNKTESGSTEYVVLIDVIWVKDIGYLIDTNSDGTYDKFYSNETGSQTDPEKLANGSYLINSDTDEDWDWIYDPETDDLSVYVKPKPCEEQDWTWLYIVILLIIILLIIIGWAVGRKKSKKKPEAPKKPKK